MPSPTHSIPKKQEIYESSTTQTQLPQRTATRTFTLIDLLIPLVLIIILMAFTMPGFMSRLFRPFTTSTSLGISAGGAGGATPLPVPEGAQKATIAAGCFWGVEHMYRKQFGGKGLHDARVGYIGGNTKNPSYQAVCREGTGHAEALQVTYDPTQITYRQLLEFFYKMHDPTTTNQQGPDRGTQYRSGIFYHDDEQKSIAEEITKKVNEKWWKGKVVTEILPAGEWWDAEQYHQLYLDKNPGGYECPSHFLRKFPDLE